MKKLFVFFVLILVICSVFVGTNIEYNKLSSLPEKIYVSSSDIDFLNNENTFGKVIKVNVDNITVGTEKTQTAKMWFKLFGIIPIKQVEVELSQGENVYLGGIPLGFAIKTKGLLVVGDNTILSENGKETINKSKKIENGDILIKINNQEILSSEEIPNILSKNQSEKIELTLLRNNEPYVCEIIPKIDINSGENKIGLWVKNDANGIGTLTFVKENSNRFGALGHAITDFETGAQIPVQNGKIYKCNQIGIAKAEKNTPGELRCIFLQGINTKGTIDKNCRFGVFGDITDLNSVVDFNRTAEIGSRLIVKTGKAKLLSAVSGVLEEYDIEIIKTAYQPESDDKSFIFRVTDKRLLDLTGGIIQGMSGSPIIQNGKLIGATTHVFLSDPTKGYGIYADWMVDE